MLLDGVWLKALQKSIEAHLLAKTVLQGSALKPASARRGAAKSTTLTTSQNIEILGDFLVSVCFPF